MKTLLLSEIFPPKIGGTSRWYWEVYRRRPAESTIVVAGDDPGALAFDRGHRLPVVRAPLTLRQWGLLSPSELLGYRGAIRAVGVVLKSEPIGEIHCGRCLPEGWIALRLRRRHRVPYLCYAHGEELNLEGDRAGGVMASRQLRWMTGAVLRNASKVVANSANTAAILRQQWDVPDRKIRVLHPGVDAERFTPTPRDPLVREGLGWGGRPVVLTVGRLTKRKGHDRLIEALPLIRKAIPDVLYAIVGDGEERPSLSALVERLGLGGHVQFLGPLDDDRMIACYQQADLFALPNRRVGTDVEGFGMVLLEAQACGRPVLTGDSGGTAETLSDPETGRVVDCDDVRTLSSAIIDLLGDRDLLERMGTAARRWAADRFDWPALSRQAEAIFAEGRTVSAPLSEAIAR